jgi:hypothetical protein
MHSQHCVCSGRTIEDLEKESKDCKARDLWEPALRAFAEHSKAKRANKPALQLQALDWATECLKNAWSLDSTSPITAFLLASSHQRLASFFTLMNETNKQLRSRRGKPLDLDTSCIPGDLRCTEPAFFADIYWDDVLFWLSTAVSRGFPWMILNIYPLFAPIRYREPFKFLDLKSKQGRSLQQPLYVIQHYPFFSVYQF